MVVSEAGSETGLDNIGMQQHMRLQVWLMVKMAKVLACLCPLPALRGKWTFFQAVMVFSCVMGAR